MLRLLLSSVQEMKRKIVIVLVLVLCGVLVARHILYRKLEASQLELDLATLAQITDGSISHELRWGRIFVTTRDKFRDGHVHLLHHPGVSKRDALKIVTEKETELRQKKPNGIGPPLAGRPSHPTERTDRVLGE